MFRFSGLSGGEPPIPHVVGDHWGWLLFPHWSNRKKVLRCRIMWRLCGSNWEGTLCLPLLGANELQSSVLQGIPVVSSPDFQKKPSRLHFEVVNPWVGAGPARRQGKCAPFRRKGRGGIRVMPPTRTTSPISLTCTPASDRRRRGHSRGDGRRGGAEKLGNQPGSAELGMQYGSAQIVAGASPNNSPGKEKIAPGGEQRGAGRGKWAIPSIPCHLVGGWSSGSWVLPGGGGRPAPFGIAAAVLAGPRALLARVHGPGGIPPRADCSPGTGATWVIHNSGILQSFSRDGLLMMFI